MHNMNSFASLFSFLITAFFLTSSPIHAQQSDVFESALDAHGGLEMWQSFQTLSYDLNPGDNRERHTIDLYSRKTRQENQSYTIGYDGSDVWITPNLDAYSGNPRFYNGLHFYFFALPFVFADPGVNVASLGQHEVSGETYDVLQFTFDDGVGDSPKDEYIGYFNTSTHRLHLLLYTVTFRSQTPGTRYNARVYEDWQQIQGLWVPQHIVSYQWDPDKKQLGDRRGVTTYDKVSFSTEAAEPGLFQKPEGAEVAQAQP